MAVVTFISDFGTRDGYVGAVKGVIASLAPAATVVDVTHDIEPHDVAAAAYVLAQVASYYPDGTVHLVVVDPGVGGVRTPVAARNERQFFVGPDNGVFDWVCAEFVEARQIDPDQVNPGHAIAPTFHGRDLFAPCAARLASGAGLATVGAPTELSGPSLPALADQGGQLVGVIVHVDRFGNLISNIPARTLGDQVSSIRAGRLMVDRVRRTFSDVAPGKPVAYIGSAGTLELAVREGSAADRFGLGRGTAVIVTR